MKTALDSAVWDMELKMLAGRKIKNLSNVVTVLVCVVLTTQTFASGLPGSVDCNSSFAAGFRDMIELASVKCEIINGKNVCDTRQTTNDKTNGDKALAAQLRKENPTRRFYCGETGADMSQANVVLRDDLVLISAHSIYDENCELYPDAKANKCHVTDTDGTKHTIDISQMISGPDSRKNASGKCKFQKDVVAGQEDPAMTGLDWALVKLSTPMPNVNPYGLFAPNMDDSKGTLIGEGQTYGFVSGGAKNMRTGKEKALHFQECKWRNHSKSSDGISYIKTDCDSGEGASGGALLNAARQIVGIQVRTSMLENAPYDEKYNYESIAPVTDELINAAQILANTTSL